MPTTMTNPQINANDVLTGVSLDDLKGSGNGGLTGGILDDLQNKGSGNGGLTGEDFAGSGNGAGSFFGGAGWEPNLADFEEEAKKFGLDENLMKKCIKLESNAKKAADAAKDALDAAGSLAGSGSGFDPNAAQDAVDKVAGSGSGFDPNAAQDAVDKFAGGSSGFDPNAAQDAVDKFAGGSSGLVPNAKDAEDLAKAAADLAGTISGIFRRDATSTDVTSAKEACIEDILGFKPDTQFENIADFGLSEDGTIDMANFNFDKAPKLENGFYPLSGKPIAAIPAFENFDVGKFDPFNFDTFPADFGEKLADMTFDFGDCPALVGVLAKQAEAFTKLEASADFFADLSTNDKSKLEGNMKQKFKDLEITGADDKLAQLSELFAKKEPTVDDIKNILINNDSLAQKIFDKKNDLVESLGKVNFYKDLSTDQIEKEINDRLENFDTVKAELVAGLPEGMTLKKFSKLVNKAGFDTQGLKKLLRKPDDFKMPTANTNRRRNTDSDATKFSKKQVANQGELAKTQEEEKDRQDKKKKSTNNASTIAISTISIAVSAVAYLF